MTLVAELRLIKLISSITDTYTGVDWSNTLHDISPNIVADLNEKLVIPDMATLHTD
jgi:hypothetical protein